MKPLFSVVYSFGMAATGTSKGIDPVTMSMTFSHTQTWQRRCSWYSLLRFILIVTILHCVSGQQAQVDPDNPTHASTSTPATGNVYDLSSRNSSDMENDTLVVDNCEAFFRTYTDAVGNFTHCELLNAKPFRLCNNCLSEYKIANSIFTDLSSPQLTACKQKYLEGDRVQIIPTLQKGMESLWKDASCDECSRDVYLDPETRRVNFSTPEDVSKFMLLYKNFTMCLNRSINQMAGDDGDWLAYALLGNTSDKCGKCKEQYTALNQHYDEVWARKQGKVCMDMVDRMNYTRQMWSSQMNCTHRSGDPVPVIVITLVVASTPFFFYVSLRITGKEKRNKIFKQKRLTTNQDAMSSTSGSVDIARLSAGGDTNTRPQRLAPFS